MPKVVVVHAGKEEYALPIENVVSIERVEEVRPIPHLPSFVLGLVKVRGELIPVLDLANILYNTNAGAEKRNVSSRRSHRNDADRSGRKRSERDS
ncbi:chemotaxis protein CheW [Rossellomorea sp. FM04394]|uniref:chemotaxis protein CheW n=1 Tax=Rossellomorea sp. FM04394 TaxID=3243076 RepID=UPI0035A60F74